MNKQENQLSFQKLLNIIPAYINYKTRNSYSFLFEGLYEFSRIGEIYKL